MLNFNYSITYFNFHCSSKYAFAIESYYNLKKNLVEFKKAILVIFDNRNCFNHNIPFPIVTSTTECIRHFKKCIRPRI